MSPGPITSLLTAPYLILWGSHSLSIFIWKNLYLLTSPLFVFEDSYILHFNFVVHFCYPPTPQLGGPDFFILSFLHFHKSQAVSDTINLYLSVACLPYFPFSFRLLRSASLGATQFVCYFPSWCQEWGFWPRLKGKKVEVDSEMP